MSTENDVPLGEGSRRYYEQQFNSRINQINKSGRAPQRDSGGSGWGGGRAGCGAVFVVIFVLRLIFLFVNTQSNNPSHDYTLPPPHFDFGEQNRLPDFPRKGNDDIPVGGPGQRPLNDEPEAGKPNDDKFPGTERLLTQDDVPLLEGLCYRIDQESRQPGPTPGKRICTPLPPPANQRLIKAARGELLRDEEQRKLLLALDTVLRDPALYDGPSFRNVPGVATLVLVNGFGSNPAKGTPRFNRLLLEKCYPDQIVPWNERNRLNGLGRAQWIRRAQSDLEKARRQFEPGKH